MNKTLNNKMLQTEAVVQGCSVQADVQLYLKGVFWEFREIFKSTDYMKHL